MLDTFEELQEWTRKIWTEGFGEALVQVLLLLFFITPKPRVE